MNWLKKYAPAHFADFSKWVYLALLIYAPWHDAAFLGQRPSLSHLPFPIINQMTTAGLANFIWIGMILICIYIPQLFVIRKIPIQTRWLEACILSWPFFVLIRTSTWDSDALVMLANSFLFSSLFLLFLRPELYKKEIHFISRFGFLFLFLSYTLSLLLPLIIEIQDYSPWQNYGPFFRYKGWTGEGQPIGFVGFILFIFSCLRIATSKRIDFFSICGILIGLLGINLNVLRISLLSVILFTFCTAIYFIVKERNIKLHLIFIILCISSTINFFTGNFYSKNVNSGYTESPNMQSSLYSLFDKKTPAYSKIIQKNEIRHLDAFITTSHRSINYELLWKEIQSNFFFGLGTGGSARYLKTVSAYPVLGGDYMRLFFDFGLLGLTFFIFIGILLIYSVKSKTFVLSMCAICSIFLTDVFLIMPAFGYGPFLLICLTLLLNSNFDKRIRT